MILWNLAFMEGKAFEKMFFREIKKGLKEEFKTWGELT
jgi:hypothetical protein